jgi:hypothetical protein
LYLILPPTIGLSTDTFLPTHFVCISRYLAYLALSFDAMAEEDVPMAPAEEEPLSASAAAAPMRLAQLIYRYSQAAQQEREALRAAIIDEITAGCASRCRERCEGVRTEPATLARPRRSFTVQSWRRCTRALWSASRGRWTRI